MLPWLACELAQVKEVFGDHCWPYKVEENRETLETLVQYLVEQSMIERVLPIEKLFVPFKESDVDISKQPDLINLQQDSFRRTSRL